MNCYECALRGEAVGAVATCGNCGVGMCLEHLGEAQSYRVGGTTFGCPHDLTAAARRVVTNSGSTQLLGDHAGVATARGNAPENSHP